jgi:hypothetical protein
VCKKDKELMCSLCALDHADHRADLSCFTNIDIQNVTRNLIAIYEELHNDIDDIIYSLSSIANKESVMKGKHLAKSLYESENIMQTALKKIQSYELYNLQRRIESNIVMDKPHCQYVYEELVDH